MIDRNTVSSASVSLEQWRAFAAVVDCGGYARAAEALGRRQSTVSHSIQRLEERLGTRVLRIQGRKAVLTEIGAVALRRARILLNESAQLERVAHTLAAGIEAEIRLAVDTIFPNQLLLPAICAFTEAYPDTRVEIIETVISGVRELLHKGTVQLAITPRVPQGWIGERLINLEMRCVAHPDHPLHRLGRPINQDDLRQHRQLVVRESGEPRSFESNWLGAEQRLTVSTMGTRIQALCAGLGFAWCPLLKITTELQAGVLKPLPLEDGGSRVAILYLLLADTDGAGPAIRSMAGIIKTQVENCSESDFA
jgi:DNA-binding transcriptional LysR family regulator